MKLYEEIKKIFPDIEKILTAENLEEFKNTRIADLCLYHIGLGVWLRNNLLHEESDLYNLFLSDGIKCTDEMSSYIIKLFHYESNKI